MKSPTNPEEIDQLLPQTQCGLCDYDGCLPYATAIVTENAPLNRCLPGGVATLEALGNHLEQDISPLKDEMAQKSKLPSIAKIMEDQCIGCTKCIQACPVDAIMGASKTMHSVISAECTGCELCLPPCPVDCITMIEQPKQSFEEMQQHAQHYRKRLKNREQRLTKLTQQQQSKHQRAKLNPQQNPKLAIQQALARAKAKKEFQHHEPTKTR